MAAPLVSSNITSTTTTAPSPQINDDEWDVIFDGIIIAISIIIFASLVMTIVFLIFKCKSVKSKNSIGSTVGRGLRNLGNTCYFNAAIQCLVSTPILTSQVETDDQRTLTTEFLRFLEPVDPENGSISIQLNPRPLLEAFCSKVPKFSGTQQHDSHELLRNFLDQLRQEERALNPNRKLTAVDKIFGGHFMTVYICKRCSTPYHVCEPFLDISVPICRGDDEPQSENSDHLTSKIETESSTPYQEAAELVMERLSSVSVELPAEILSITDSLKYFTRKEKIGEQYLCNSCSNNSSSSVSDSHGELGSQLTAATKQTLIFNPPAVLVIHLKRFEMKRSGFVKRTNKIKFDKLLDLAPYCSAWCHRNEARERNIWYSLYAVVVHSGTLRSGHYVAYVKDRDDSAGIEQFLQKEFLDRDITADQLSEMMKTMARKGSAAISTKHLLSEGNWHCMNDSSVSRVLVDEVLRKEAFLLFYERVAPVGWLK